MDNEGVKEIADLARQGAGVTLLKVEEKSIRNTPIVLASVPSKDGTVALFSTKHFLDEWRLAPERIAGTARALTLDSFVSLLNRHKSADTAVFGDLNLKTPSLLAVIDYHALNHTPAFTKHRIAYAFPISPEWKCWQSADGAKFDQHDFAVFIEDHIADLTSPMDQESSIYEPLFRTKFGNPSDLMTLSRGLEICVEGKVKEIRNLANGEASIAYDEVHKDGAGQALVVPGLFMVAIPLFVGGEKERVVVRLRYRKVNTSVVWIMQFYRADIVVREALERTLLNVGERTALPTYEGSPEA